MSTSETCIRNEDGAYWSLSFIDVLLCYLCFLVLFLTLPTPCPLFVPSCFVFVSCLALALPWP
jgi:hypothetical protein